MTLIEAYEEEHHSIPDASPVEILRALIQRPAPEGSGPNFRF
jgi:antitoxin component HigA of HigAB toxin-antitoxin module